jgi:hypothetical protein
MLKNYINADALIDILNGNFELGYTDVFITSILNDQRDIMFELDEIGYNVMAMVPTTDAAAIWNGKTGYITDLNLSYTFQPPEYVRNANGIILNMVLEDEIYLDVDTFAVNFNNGAICFNCNLF